MECLLTYRTWSLRFVLASVISCVGISSAVSAEGDDGSSAAPKSFVGRARITKQPIRGEAAEQERLPAPGLAEPEIELIAGEIVSGEGISTIRLALSSEPRPLPSNNMGTGGGPIEGTGPTILPSTASSNAPGTLQPKPAGVMGEQIAPNSDPLIDQLTKAIEVTSQRHLTANVHSPWQIFHGILALHQNFKLKLGDQKVGAIDWVATADPVFDGRKLILVTPHGAKFHPFTRPWAFEGHPAQFLALLSESELPVTFELVSGDKKVTILDMLNNTMMEVNDQEEITWVLWALNRYLKPDAAWTNQRGEAWSIERLVKTQTAAPVHGTACGGNHGLFVLSRARDKYLATGRTLRGDWLEADQKVKQYIEVARSLQNSDGSFSANFYQGPKFSNDLNTRLNTTGHTLEFLSIGVAESRLQEPWIRNAAAVLSKDLIDNRKTPADCGPLYHSLNSLILYRARLLKTSSAGTQPSMTAQLPAVDAGKVPLATTVAPLPSLPAVGGPPGVAKVMPRESAPVKLLEVPHGEPAAPGAIDTDREGPVSALKPVNRY